MHFSSPEAYGRTYGRTSGGQNSLLGESQRGMIFRNSAKTQGVRSFPFRPALLISSHVSQCRVSAFSNIISFHKVNDVYIRKANFISITCTHYPNMGARGERRPPSQRSTTVCALFTANLLLGLPRNAALWRAASHSSSRRMTPCDGSSPGQRWCPTRDSGAVLGCCGEAGLLLWFWMLVQD